MPGEFTFDSGRRSTRVMVRPGIRREVPIAQDRRTLVVVDQSVADSFGKDVAESLQAQGVAVAMLTIEATESAKSLKRLVAFLMRPSPTEWIAGECWSPWAVGSLVTLWDARPRCTCAGLRSCTYRPRCWPWWMLPRGEDRSQPSAA